MTIVLFVLISIFGSVSGLFTAESTAKLQFKEVCADFGDTLWELACEYNSSEIDTRKLVENICKINNIENKVIYPGQLIKIPIYN